MKNRIDKILQISIVVITISFVISLFFIVKKEKELENIIEELEYQEELKNDNYVEIKEFVTLTTYNPVKEQCDENPLITANGTKIDLEKLKNEEIKYCAVSRDLLKDFPYGSIIEIEGYGEYLVCDIMNKRFIKYVDILQDVNKKNFKKKNIKIVKIN